MFDLHKDMERYKGVPPYASELYGVYQPLLGWQSQLTKTWIRHGGAGMDPALRAILDARIAPGPTEELGNEPDEWLASPSEPGHGISPYRVILARDFDSELLTYYRPRVEAWVRQRRGALPQGQEWVAVFQADELLNRDNGPLRQINNNLRLRFLSEAQNAVPPDQALADEVYVALRAKHFQIMQYESQIAALLLIYAEGQEGRDPNELAKFFRVLSAPELSSVFAPTDPLAHIDPRDRSGVLAPVGFVHLFRQYFFDLGTFTGEPVEHVWLSPGSTVELVETSSRRTVVERTEETAFEGTQRVESENQITDELSDAVRAENSSSTKLGVSTNNTVKVGVYEGTATADLSLESSRKEARETTHKQTREQTEKLSTEIKRSFKSVIKVTTESTDTRSRRYLLQNNSEKLVNYELRRKMRRVGVQLQDIGTRLCWQAFIDDPGQAVGLAELAHFAEAPDVPQAPGLPPPPTNVSAKVTVPIPFRPVLDYDDNGAGSIYEWRYPENDVFLGNRSNTEDEDAQDHQIIMGPFTFKIDPPQPGYQLTDDIRVLGPQGAKLAQVRGRPQRNADGSFSLVMQQLSFGGEQSVSLDMELIFAPGPAAYADYEATKKRVLDNYDTERSRILKKALVDDIRKRIEAYNNIAQRPSWDLREEERTIIYRNLIKRLMQDSWNLTDSPANSRLNHVRSEMVRTIFDVDAMLYFVAPEWWMPRRHRSNHAYDPNAKIDNAPISLTDGDGSRWHDVEKRPDNYSITEKSNPARLGSSLGWLLQVDGDNLRNAFLNAPWVKAVIPVRPGREQAALNWLKAIEGHEGDGWDAPYLGADGDAALVAEVEADGLGPATVGRVLDKVAEQLAVQNGEIANTLQADKVFEFGFNPLQGGFDAGLPANEVYSQWISILPTEQLVAVEYQERNLLEQ